MGLIGIPVVGDIVGGFFEGAGNVKKNFELKGQKKKLKYQINNLNEMLEPARDAMVLGLQPGGELRSFLGVPGIEEAQRTGAAYREAAGQNAYRYGGRKFGKSGSFLDQAEQAGPQSVLARAEGEVQADDLLTRIDAAIRGAQNAFPEAQPTNRLAAYGAGISAFGEAFDQSYAY